MKAKEKKREMKNLTGKWLELLPLILILAVLPLVVHLKIVPTGLENYPWFPDESSRGDFFAYWRTRIFEVLALWMLVVLVDRRVIQRKKWKFAKSWILLGSFLVLTVLSTIFSRHGSFAWNGIVENYEGGLAILSYGVAFFYASQVIEDEKDVKLLLWVLVIGTAVQIFFGLCQLAGHDFWSSSLGKMLAAPGKDLSFRFGESKKNPVYMAFYNPNYAAIYIVMMMPLLVFLFFDSRKLWQKGICLAGMVLLLVCLKGTSSRTAFVTLPLLAGVWLFFWMIKRHWWKRMEIFAAILLIAGAIIIGRNPIEHLKYDLQKMEVTDKGILIKMKGKQILVNADQVGDEKAELKIKTKDGTEVPLEQSEDGIYTPQDEKLEKFSFETWQEDGYLYIVLYYKQEPFYFVTDGVNGYTYVTLYGKVDSMVVADACGLEGYERLFGERMYIWSRTLPLLKNHILLGSGPDTFALEFPQNDQVARINTNHNLYEEILTKPHSLYLQTALQTGVLSLICILGFWICYFVRVLIRSEKNQTAYTLEFALAFSSAGYLIMGLVNDSMTMTAPIFWVLLGVGYALNLIRHS